MSNLLRIFRKLKPEPFITIVSGLPRSGTSMMMKMLDAGGIPPLTDHIRVADKDNPKGYYEFERVKKMPDGDKAWLAEARGKTVKVISALLEHLPPEHTYKIVFLHRQIEEILASQRQMLIRSGKPTDKVSDEKLAEMYRKHLAKVEAWMDQQPNMSVLYLNYNDILADPEPHVARINQFLGNHLDAAKMAETVDPNLYRQRQTD